MPQYWIRCPKANCHFPQPFKAQQQCNKCNEEMSNWDVAVQVREKITEEQIFRKEESQVA